MSMSSTAKSSNAAVSLGASTRKNMKFLNNDINYSLSSSQTTKPSFSTEPIKNCNLCLQDIRLGASRLRGVPLLRKGCPGPAEDQVQEDQTRSHPQRTERKVRLSLNRVMSNFDSLSLTLAAQGSSKLLIHNLMNYKRSYPALPGMSLIFFLRLSFLGL